METDEYSKDEMIEALKITNQFFFILKEERLFTITFTFYSKIRTVQGLGPIEVKS